MNPHTNNSYPQIKFKNMIQNISVTLLNRLTCGHFLCMEGRRTDCAPCDCVFPHTTQQTWKTMMEVIQIRQSHVFFVLFYTDDGDGNGRTSEKAASQIQPPEMNFAASSVTDGEGV